MKTGYLQHLKRRKEGKTDYKKRLNLIRFGKPRLVVRTTNKQIIASIMNYKKDGDETLISVTSTELRKFNWKHSVTNIPSSYLTGLLLASVSKKKKITECVLDIGLYTPTKGAKIFAVLKGAVDGGLKIPHSEGKIPDETRLKGEHIASYKKNKNVVNDFEKTKQKILTDKM